ncbi:hypothetical protein LTR97_007799 [Elasticomyces elasticus]|uniref:C2H2-type domain-containing protein n=1 Tax=Elasticomyces elasticus TaxID=574655 RepID=A0AAN7WCY1_9PEZI|nr:hypothetical protein LTR97_007799 [Elasticomyces elasticus]
MANPPKQSDRADFDCPDCGQECFDRGNLNEHRRSHCIGGRRALGAQTTGELPRTRAPGRFAAADSSTTARRRSRRNPGGEDVAEVAQAGQAPESVDEASDAERSGQSQGGPANSARKKKQPRKAAFSATDMKISFASWAQRQRGPNRRKKGRPLSEEPAIDDQLAKYACLILGCLYTAGSAQAVYQHMCTVHGITIDPTGGQDHEDWVTLPNLGTFPRRALYAANGGLEAAILWHGGLVQQTGQNELSVFFPGEPTTPAINVDETRLPLHNPAYQSIMLEGRQTLVRRAERTRTRLYTQGGWEVTDGSGEEALREQLQGAISPGSAGTTHQLNIMPTNSGTERSRGTTRMRGNGGPSHPSRMGARDIGVPFSLHVDPANGYARPVIDPKASVRGTTGTQITTSLQPGESGLGSADTAPQRTTGRRRQEHASSFGTSRIEQGGLTRARTHTSELNEQTEREARQRLREFRKRLNDLMYPIAPRLLPLAQQRSKGGIKLLIPGPATPMTRSPCFRTGSASLDDVLDGINQHLPTLRESTYTIAIAGAILRMLSTERNANFRLQGDRIELIVHDEQQSGVPGTQAAETNPSPENSEDEDSRSSDSKRD